MDCLNTGNRNLAAHQTRSIADVYKSYTYFRDGDVLLAKITPCFENGKLGVARELKNGIGFGSSEYFVIRPDKEILSDYIYYYLDQQCFRDAGKRVMTGAVGHKRVPREFLEALPFPRPPLEEQRRIVAVLDEAFEGLDRARVHAEGNARNTKRLFAAGVDDLLSRDRRGWLSGQLSELVGQVFTGPFGSLLHKSDYVEGEIPIVNPANIIEGRIVPDRTKTVSGAALAKLRSYILEIDDIVLARRGEMGRCAVVESEQAGWLCGTGSFFIRPRPGIDARLVAHVLRTPGSVKKLSAIATGTTMFNLSNKALASLPIELPSESDQARLLERIDILDHQTRSTSVLYCNKIVDLDDLRQSLLQRAFAGELT